MGSTKGEDKGCKSFDEKDSNRGERIHKGDGTEGGFQKPTKTAKRERGGRGRKKRREQRGGVIPREGEILGLLKACFG